MAAPPTNKYIIGVALQSGEGSVASAPQYRIMATAADMRPSMENAQRDETSASRDPGERVVTSRMVSGNFTTILRPASAPLLYYGVLGAKASSTSGPLWAASTTKALGDYVVPTASSNPDLFEATVAGDTGTAEPTWPSGVGSTVTDGTVTWTNRGPRRNNHLLSPADDQPWLTIWRFWGGVLSERLEDCKLASAAAEGGADTNSGDITAQFGVVGKNYADVSGSIAFDPYDPADSGGGTFDDGEPVRWFGTAINVDGSLNPDIDQFSNTIEAGQEAARTQQVYPSRVEPTRRTTEHSYQEVYRDLAAYKRAAYGGPSLTSPSDGISYAPWDGTWVDASGVERMRLSIPRFAFLDGPLPVNPNGELARIGVSGGADKPSAGSVLEVEFDNAVASYPASA